MCRAAYSMLAKAKSRPITSPDPTARKFANALPLARATAGEEMTLLSTDADIRRLPNFADSATHNGRKNTIHLHLPNIGARVQGCESSAFRPVERRRGHNFVLPGPVLYRGIVETIS